MNIKELESLDEALDYLNGTSLCENTIILEFNAKDTIHNMIEKVKTAFVNLINKIQSALSKCKDSKIKTSINGVLQKAKDGLTKTNSVKEDDDNAKATLEELKNAFGELSVEFRLVAAPVSQTTIDSNSLKTYITGLKSKGSYGGDKVVLFGYEDSICNKASNIFKKSKFKALKNYKPAHNVMLIAYNKETGDTRIVKKWKDMDSTLDSKVSSSGGYLVFKD